MKYFRRTSAIAATVAAVLFSFSTSAEEISVIVHGGLQGDASVEAFTKPFEEETGIKVNALKVQPGTAKLRLQMETGNVDFDVAMLLADGGDLAFSDGLLAPIDYSIYSQDELKNFDKASLRNWGVESFLTAYVMALNSEHFSSGEPAPASWADFWNVEKFPGRRMLLTGEAGIRGPWEEALLADGVPMDQLYPLDIDRIFKSLDKIRPNVRKWWKPAEIEQLLGANTVDMTMSYDTSANLLKDAGKPILVNYNQAKVYGVYWFIPKASKNQEAAQKFIEFATRAKQQAKFADLYTAAPANSGAFEFVKPEVAPKLITYPENKKNTYRINQAWYAEKGPDGKTNSDRLREKWNSWIVQ